MRDIKKRMTQFVTQHPHLLGGPGGERKGAAEKQVGSLPGGWTAGLTGQLDAHVAEGRARPGRGWGNEVGEQEDYQPLNMEGIKVILDHLASCIPGAGEINVVRQVTCAVPHH